MLVLLLACSDSTIVAFEPSLSLSRDKLVFEGLVLGEPAEETLQVGNAGRAPLRIDSVSLGAPFELDWRAGELAPGEVVGLTVGLSPEVEGDWSSTLTVVSNDPEAPVRQVEVLAEPRAPDIVPDPEELIWASAEGGEERLRVRNDGQGPLRIHRLDLVSDGGGVFALTQDALPRLMEPGEEAWLDLSAEASEGAAGVLRIQSNDPDEPLVDVPLSIGASVLECPDEDWPAETVELDPSCLFDGLDAVWDPVIETAWRAFPTDTDRDLTGQVVVGRVSDDDGDGDVDEEDPPDLALITREGDHGNSWEVAATLRLLAGDGSAEHWSVGEFELDGQLWSPNIQGGVALGDVDGDGLPEVVTAVKHPSDTGYGLACLDHEGQLEWLTELDYPEATGAPWRWTIAPAIADVDGDGLAEIVVGRSILAGLDGELLAEGELDLLGTSTTYVNGGPKSVPIDLDADGTMEVLVGPYLMAPDGSTICSADVDDAYPAAADLDNDGDGEVVLSGSGEVTLMDHDCEILDSWATPDGGAGGAPTLADFDGDGQVEIGLASKYFYYVFETDGSVLWSAPIRDESSHSTGSSVFDFDGDGSSEVVFADEYDLFVLDGQTGRPRFLWTGHANGTGTELPVIADVDGDGSAEIVLGHNSYRDEEAVGCSVIGSASSGWMPARPVWNQHAFSMSHIEDDLGVPADTSPNWPELNTFRSADTLASSGLYDRNARPALAGVCNLDCDQDRQRVVVRVDNPGLEDLPAGVEVELRTDILGEETAIARQVVEVPIPSGTSSEGLVFDVDLGLIPDRSLLIVVDPSDLLTECDEDDNRLEVLASLCP
jgi:hypothetical protein